MCWNMKSLGNEQKIMTEIMGYNIQIKEDKFIMPFW